MVGHIHNLEKKDYMALIPNYNLEKERWLDFAS